jgi:hypothetical protein
MGKSFIVGFKRNRCSGSCRGNDLWCNGQWLKNLTSEAVQSPSLALECVHNVHGGNGLAASVLGVGHGVTDDVLEEHLEHSAGLLVDEAGDALDTTTACETADGGLGDALDVVPEDLTVALGASLAESLSSLSATRLRARDRESQGRGQAWLATNERTGGRECSPSFRLVELSCCCIVSSGGGEGRRSCLAWSTVTQGKRGAAR